MGVVGFRKAKEELRSDMTLTLTSSMSMDQIQAHIDHLPRYLNANLTIQFSDGTYVPDNGKIWTFGGFCGTGTLTIQGNPSESGLHTNQAVIFTLGVNHATVCLNVASCSCPVIVKNMRFNRSAATLLYYHSLGAVNDYDVTIHGCCFDSENQSCRGVLTYYSNVRFYNNYGGALQQFFLGYACSNNLVWDNDDISAGDRPTYGYLADHASIGYYGTTPSCVTSVATSVNGGRIWT